VHGLMLNNWWDRETKAIVNCTDDSREQLVAYSGHSAGIGQSARLMLVPALADEIRLQQPTASRVGSVSLKARSAITLAGHRPDAATWMDEEGYWVTSTAFSKAPVSFIASYVSAHPVSAELGRTWDRALPKPRYFNDDSPFGRRAPAIGTLNFPHQVRKAGDPLDAAFVAAWEASPFSDAYVAALAAATIDGLKLGRNGGTDFLGISFSALDKVGHDLGPDSHEVQDVLIRLDRELGTLLDKLDREVGRGRYVVALSADHGVAPVPERIAAAGFDAGRIDVPKLTDALEAVLAKHFGTGPHVAKIVHTDVYLQPGLYDKLTQKAEAMAAVLNVVRTTPGVLRVYRKEALIAGNDSDPIARSAAASYFEGRSGDLVFLPRPYWIPSTNTTNHGTGHRYDTHVPLLLFGQGIKPGEYLQPATPIDVAPTLAFLASVTLSSPSGRVLVEALDRSGPARGAR
jgi:hypothetical protein